MLTWKKATTLLSVSYAYMLEYRAELFLWAVSGSLPIILMGVWIEAASNANFGLKPIDFAHYFISVFLVRQFTVIWVIWEFETEVVEGKLSFALLQPIDPVWRHLMMHIAERFARFPFTIALIILFFVLYPEAAWIPKFTNILFCLIATLLAFGLRFLIQYTFAMFSFWIERATAIEQFWFLFYIVLSGYIAPLEVFPPLIRDITLLTPFPYLIHFPAAILVGLPVDLTKGILVISAWMLIFGVLNRWLWRKGLKHYSGMGA